MSESGQKMTDVSTRDTGEEQGVRPRSKVPDGGQRAKNGNCYFNLTFIDCNRETSECELHQNLVDI